MRLQTTSVLLCTCYTACNVIHAYIVHVLLASILQNFLSDSHASVKFKLSCTVITHNLLIRQSSLVTKMGVTSLHFVDKYLMLLWLLIDVSQ